MWLQQQWRQLCGAAAGTPLTTPAPPATARPFGNTTDFRDRLGCTALHVALLHGHLEAAQACIDNGAEMLFRLNGLTYLQVAICLGAIPSRRPFVAKAVPLLVSAGCSWQVPDARGRTALHVAALYGLEDIAALATR